MHNDYTVSAVVAADSSYTAVKAVVGNYTLNLADIDCMEATGKAAGSMVVVQHCKDTVAC